MQTFLPRCLHSIKSPNLLALVLRFRSPRLNDISSYTELPSKNIRSTGKQDTTQFQRAWKPFDNGTIALLSWPRGIVTSQKLGDGFFQQRCPHLAGRQFGKHRRSFLWLLEVTESAESTGTSWFSSENHDQPVITGRPPRNLPDMAGSHQWWWLSTRRICNRRAWTHICRPPGRRIIKSDADWSDWKTRLTQSLLSLQVQIMTVRVLGGLL